mmetsp:Transcript_11704/g.17927  ORF Transcript_11704/g.17927 Transcript_11704/m.17927 type:complete len:112 (-) Transcript_11704:137-472(-)
MSLRTYFPLIHITSFCQYAVPAEDNDGLLCLSFAMHSTSSEAQNEDYVKSYSVNRLNHQRSRPEGWPLLKHGAKKLRKLCTASDCTNQTAVQGVCKIREVKLLLLIEQMTY